MFRRRRGSSRPPAASAWWPDSPEDDDPELAKGEDQAPPLPTEDPFGGWPAFGPGDPTDAVLGQPDPMSVWTSEVAPPTSTPGHPPPGHGAVTDPAGVPGNVNPPPGQSGTPGQTGPPGRANPSRHAEPSRHAGPPGHAGPPDHAGPNGVVTANAGAPPTRAAAGGQPAPAGARSPQRAPYRPRSDPAMSAHQAPPATEPSTGSASGALSNGMDAGHTEWLPLLTHDDQRFQARPEAHQAPAAAAEAVARQRNGRPRTKRRAGRGLRGHRPPPPGAMPATAPTAPSVDTTTAQRDPVAPPHPMEAAALAGAFAADYLSWDEQAPERRGQVLAQYLPSDVVGNATLLGWSGKGRQRAEFALPGAVRPDGEGRVVVDVRVRVTPYRAVGQPSEPAPVGDLEVAGVPAVAPAPTARGWKSLDSYWVRLTVPVNRDQGRLVVDTWDEQLGEEPEPPSPTPGTLVDPTTAEDLGETETTTNQPTTNEPAAHPAPPASEATTQRDPHRTENNPHKSAHPAPPAGTQPSASTRPGKPGRSGERGRPGAPHRGGGR